MSGDARTTAALGLAIRRTPTTIPALVALALFVAWAGDQAGYPLTHWAPGGLIVLALGVIALAGMPPRLAEVPRSVRVAVGCLALYTALSFLSILWAQVPGDAWEGANRTLLYLLVFALFALWRQRAATAALLVGGWALAMVGLAAFVLLHVDSVSRLAPLFGEGRLRYPAGYENASAATWAMAIWPAFLLATCRPVPWALRGLLAGGTVLLADLALLSQSRGSFYATPLMLILVFALVPWRVRAFTVLVPSAAAIGVTAPLILRVGDRLLHGGDVRAALHHATAATLIAAALVAAVVAVGAAVESRRPLAPSSAALAHKGLGALGVAALVAALVGGLVAAGDPIARIEHGWATFKGGYAANRKTGSRLTSGLGSNRYDFYRVALDEFAAHPAVGIGADNFQQQYLVHGRSDETPHYPHSVELRTLTETGLVGVLLALVGLGAALLAGARAALSRRNAVADPLGAGVAAAALAGFTYWALHGSVDWFWEFAGLGAPAFALLGLACALGPRARADANESERRRRTGVGRAAALALGSVALLAVVASLAAPWLSQRQIQDAARVWTTKPRRAYALLDEAARLNPLSDQAYLVAGTIALRYGDLGRAERQFALALGRTHDDAYATLERGAIASTRGQRRRARALLQRALALDPRDALAREAMQRALKGEKVDVQALNRSILLKARRLS
jgi:tetratricopeptide (TPR) repeat protein